MMHCSYQLSRPATSKNVCVKGHTGAHLVEDLRTETISNRVLKKSFSICQNCPVRKRLTFYGLVN